VGGPLAGETLAGETLAGETLRGEPLVIRTKEKMYDNCL
jgi:hypothetical protein